MQEVIVYRSPVEAAFWHALENGSFVPIFGGILAFFVALWITIKISDQVKCGWRTRQKMTNVMLWISAAVGIFTVWYLW